MHPNSTFKANDYSISTQHIIQPFKVGLASMKYKNKQSIHILQPYVW